MDIKFQKSYKNKNKERDKRFEFERWRQSKGMGYREKEAGNSVWQW